MIHKVMAATEDHLPRSASLSLTKDEFFYLKATFHVKAKLTFKENGTR